MKIPFNRIHVAGGEDENDLQSEEVSSKVPGKVPSKIIELILQNPNITSMELGKKLNISDRMVRKYVAELKKAGKLERIGADKNGYWKVKEPELEE